MKKTVYIISLLLVSHASLAVNKKDITYDNVVDQCLDKYYEFSSECLEDLNEKTEAELKKAYETKLKSLGRVDYTKWWMGDEDRKKRMIELFKRSQAEWLKYRDDYCGVAVAEAASTHYLGNAATACNINMNRQRIKEIQMLHITSLE
ncbi:lysozyme inhibitor LprI family protein [Cronobacter malonaticus]